MTVKVQRGPGTMDLTFSLKNKRDMKKMDRWIEEAGKVGVGEASERLAARETTKPPKRKPK